MNEIKLVLGKRVQELNILLDDNSEKVCKICDKLSETTQKRTFLLKDTIYLRWNVCLPCLRTLISIGLRDLKFLG